MKFSTPSINPVAVRKDDIRTLFTNITPRYDLLNDLLSFRLDAVWRSRAVQIGLKKPAGRLLDIGAGTGKLLGAFLKKGSFKYALGLDLCESMLEKAKKEAGANTFLTCADGTALPLKDKSFDLAVSAFTLRSIPDLSKFFSELYRVLAPGGRIVMLELTRPQSWWLRAAYYPYLRFYLPFLGWLISGDRHAYRFLADSISHFKERGELLAFITSEGFQNADALNLTGGLATIFVAEKPS